jgi:UDP:flavonoid glycosyltransferase YjiC (YdhE family)
VTRFLFATVSLAGHTNPAVPIATELVSRGHEVVWMTGRSHEATVVATGARFVALESTPDESAVPLSERFPEREGLEGLAGIRFDIKHLFLDAVPPQLADLRRVLSDQPADVVVADPGFPGASVCHELGGPPFATIGVLPLPLPSRDLAPFGMGLPPIGGFGSRVRSWAIRTGVRLIMRDVDRHHRALRSSLGLPTTTKDLMSAFFSPYLVLQSGTPVSDYPRSDLPASVHYVGPLVASGASASASAEDWASLAGGRPLVVVTQGTIANDGPELLAPALVGLADEPVFVVAIGPATGLPVPANAKVLPFAPYAELFSHASAVVTNGGMGGVQEALAHGLPLVVAGTSEDKPEVAARVAWIGAGINLRTSAPAPSAVRSAVRRVLSEQSFASTAGRVAEDYARHRPGPESADLLEELAVSLGCAALA